jgi:hypothetical protein
VDEVTDRSQYTLMFACGMTHARRSLHMLFTLKTSRYRLDILASQGRWSLAMDPTNQGLRERRD